MDNYIVYVIASIIIVLQTLDRIEHVKCYKYAAHEYYYVMYCMILNR